MRDRFGRVIDYMRISVTDRCNLRCVYCMPGEVPDIPHGEILRYEEILRVCRAAAGLGIKTFRVTGGEPLVRRDVSGFLEDLGRIPGVERLAVTTNGVLLQEKLEDLLRAGVSDLNVSLDTTDRETFRALTGRDALGRVLGGVGAALAAGLGVKLNCVLLSGVNDGELETLAALAETQPLDVRFIELMPVGCGAGFDPVPGERVLERLRQRYPGLNPIQERRGSGPAVYYAAPELMGAIGFIDARYHDFCGGCNRIRLSSDGGLKRCLFDPDPLDLRAALRSGAGEEALQQALQAAVAGKPRGKCAFGPQRESMSRIGG